METDPGDVKNTAGYANPGRANYDLRNELSDLVKELRKNNYGLKRADGDGPMDLSSKIFISGAALAAAPHIVDYLMQSLNPQKGKKIGFGTKTVLTASGIGLMGFGLFARTGKKIWNFVYPPTLKRYLAVGMILGTGMVVRHCGAVEAELGHIYNGVKNYEFSRPVQQKPAEVVGPQKNRFQEQSLAISNTAANEPAARYLPVSDPAPNYANPLSRPKSSSLKTLESEINSTDYRYVIYTDLSDSSVTLYRKANGALEQVSTYSCTTGLNKRPKQSEGDDATPIGLSSISEAGPERNINTKDLRHMFYLEAWPGIVLGGSNAARYLDAIRKRDDVTRGGIICAEDATSNIVQTISGNYSRSLVLVEDSRNPIRISGVR